MPRAHWLILAFGIVLVLIVSLSRDENGAPDPLLGTADSDRGRADLLMEGAEITQFDADGELDYRLVAARITHYPESGSTLLDSPELTLHRPSGPPWRMSARRGRIDGAGELLDGAPGNDAEPGRSAQIVILEQDVQVRRDRSGDRFVDLQTDYLEFHPEQEYARTDRPVIISTESGRTTATGLEADLAGGHLQLGPGVDARVRTTLFPDRIR
ncbi:MAG: LPS export ABC transporter periplasmic protein LptC [Gammaproteobacteria bacterium]|nr:LPS export ABC transporter periplasmic protein LptC [Gammaproteobacteria bacterium]